MRVRLKRLIAFSALSVGCAVIVIIVRNTLERDQVRQAPLLSVNRFTAAGRPADIPGHLAFQHAALDSGAVVAAADWDERIHLLQKEWKTAAAEQRRALLERFAAGTDSAALPEVLGRLIGAVDHEMLLPLQRVLFRKLTGNDPSRAAELAEALPPSLDGGVIRLEVALNWAEADLPRAAAWLAQWGDGTAQQVAVRTMSAYLADTDAPRAKEWIAAMPDTALTAKLIEQACARGGGRAFDAILAWAQELPAGPRKEKALIPLVYRWEKRDFPAARTYIQNLADNDSLAVLLANQWVERESEAAAAWAAALPEGERRQKVLASLTAKWAQKDPEAAAEFVHRNLGPSEAQQQATISVVSAWAAQDPQAVANWVERFPSGPLRTYAMENVVFAWAATDSDAASLWLSRMPHGPDRDAALKAGVARLMRSRTDLAAQWATAIGSDAERQRNTIRAARAWLASDEAAARNWIATANLPESMKRRLLPRR